MRSPLCASPTFFMETMARSLYLDAHTPLRAVSAAAQRSPPSGQLMPCASMAAARDDLTSPGTCIPITSSRQLMRSASRVVSGRSMNSSRRSSSCRTAAFSGCWSASSKVPKGKVTLAGSLTQSGSCPRSPAMFLDLAPTTPSRNSSIPITYLPHHCGATSCCVPTWKPLLAASAAPLSTVPASVASQLTSPAALVRTTIGCPASEESSLMGPSSWHVAKSTLSLRARTATCERTSGESVVSTATAPMGISSSPVTSRDTRMVGRSYTFSCTSWSPGTTST
mmetsp:Transcript_4147/g.13107  ORF Transcript_4147/g.13107 Transcript_4147/m.13107 type:complete len:281 (-) Transcript_4147:666-1508(-)